MYILRTQGQDFDFLWDEHIKCPDCNSKFEDIANIRKQYKKHYFLCNMCGKCLKERESSNPICDQEHVFEKTPLEERRPYRTGPPTL